MESESSGDEKEFQYKVIVLGNGAVGKTSLIRYYCESGFAQNYKQTIGLDFYSKKVKLPGPKGSPEGQLQIWDIGGQQIGGTMLNNYIFGCDAVCLVYDVTNMDSFKDLEDWKAAVEKSAAATNGNKMPRFYLVGNKVDLPNRQVEESLHNRALLATPGSCGFIVSARSGEKVNALFTKIACDLSGVEIKKFDLDLADQATANVMSAPQERAKADRTPIITSVSTSKKESDCSIM